ncbi:MAG: SpoIIE family protein phosphatase [Bacteroidales bacterium]|nr:SpoIIE family protein phosphatase [Bacteroidales bacterium]
MLFNRKTRNTKLELEKNKEKLSSQKEENIHQQSIIESQKLSVKRSNEILTQSIKYAQHIQRAALSNIEEVKKLFPDSFLCYMPKDVVSGDFYYVTQIGDFNVFVIADCTGHGVPGGFLSIFGISAIKEILNRPNNNFMPGKILDSMREFIKESLSNNGEENFSTVDGMDMSVCAYNPKTHELRFAGAYLSAYIWSNGEIIRLKGDRMPVGRHVRETSDFNTQIVTLNNNDMLYMMTDGIQGQMGGLSGTKFMTKRLLQFLSENAILKCEEQKNNFEKIMKDWMFNTIQFDDMTLVGIRIN